MGEAVDRALTSAEALLLPRQDAGAVNDADALQDLIGQLGAHEPGRDGRKAELELGLALGSLSPQRRTAEEANRDTCEAACKAGAWRRSLATARVPPTDAMPCNRCGRGAGTCCF